MHRIFALLIFALSIFAAAARPGVEAYPGLEDYVYPGNKPASPKASTFTADGTGRVTLSDDRRQILLQSLENPKAAPGVLLDLGNTREVQLKSIDGYIISPDSRKILVWNEEKPVYRNSFTAVYYVYDCHSRELKPLSRDIKRQQSPAFSPDSRMVAFFNPDDNNLYIAKLDYNTQVAVTTDGALNHVINGIPDWTYQEEFSTESSFAWAADNLTLVFLKYNESAVPAFSFTTYGTSCDSPILDSPYPGRYSYKYPVAGSPNSRVTLHSYDVETRKLKDIQLPDSRIEYIPRIAYIPGDPSRLIVTTLNREQTRMELYMVNPRSTTASSLIVEESTKWLDPETYENMTVSASGIVILSSRSGYRHLYQYSLAGAMTRQITQGNYDVTAYYGCDRMGNHYYQSNSTGTTRRVVSKIDAKGQVKNLTPDSGTAAAVFNPGCTYYQLSYSSATKAPVYTLVSASSSKTIMTLEDNAAYAARYASMPVKEFITIQSTATGGDTPDLNAYIIRPKDFTPTGKYPVILYQYSGPGSQMVLDRWEADFTSYYATRGYIVVCVDPRGTGGRGRAFMDVVYKDLGHYETIDLIAAARYIATLPGVDGDRIGIHGWSYGGYETLMAVTDPSAPFKVAVAVAPVTDWRYYDTVYTERYMTTPGMNESGYNRSSPCRRASNLNARLLIMSGTSDDNVHLFNTIAFQNALAADGLFCDMLLFPGMNHSINGCDNRRLVYARALDYFDRNL
ncbi:MAG: alpha/beta fold hydrolase [Muribaculaceae bacterium]|nr:alpha/beta fold hydrolase [Muribaculaceae bacterium]